MSESTGDRGHLQALKTKNTVLADLLGLRAQGALVRSRFQNFAEILPRNSSLAWRKRMDRIALFIVFDLRMGRS